VLMYILVLWHAILGNEVSTLIHDVDIPLECTRFVAGILGLVSASAKARNAEAMKDQCTF
jgi:hypothetical protein